MTKENVFLLGLVSDRKAYLLQDNLNIKSGCLCVYRRKQDPPCCFFFFLNKSKLDPSERVNIVMLL